MFFLIPAVFQYFFFRPPIIFHLPSNERGDTTPQIPWGPSQLSLFSHFFSLTLLYGPPSILVLEEIYWVLLQQLLSGKIIGETAADALRTYL